MSERLDRYRGSVWARGPPREQGGKKARAIYQMDTAAKRIRGKDTGVPMTLHDDDQPTHQPDHDALGVLIWSRDGTPMVWTKEEMIADLCSRCSASELAEFIAESRALTATLSKPGIAQVIAGMQDTYGGRLLKMFYEAGGYAERATPAVDPTRKLP